MTRPKKRTRKMPDLVGLLKARARSMTPEERAAEVRQLTALVVHLMPRRTR